MPSGISYVDEVWPVLAGCTVVSIGCENCWAMRLAATRLKHHPDYAGLAHRTEKGHYQWTGEVRLLPSKLDQPLHWRAPKTIFVCSQSDLFHEAVPTEFIDQVFAVMSLSPQHQFLVLTKRPERMPEYMTELVKGPWAGRSFTDGKPSTDVEWRIFDAVVVLSPKVSADVLNRAFAYHAIHTPDLETFLPTWPLPNVILGVTVENREQTSRIDILRRTSAAKTWISFEPLLEDVGQVNLDGISWCVVGCESGPNARPMQENWARSIRDQCVAAGVGFYFKQQVVMGKLVHLPHLDGRKWEERI